jgi:hypothetical protein
VDDDSCLFQDVPLFSPNTADDDFNRELLVESHSITSKTQMRSQSHSATCFKYGNKVSVASVCYETLFDLVCRQSRYYVGVDQRLREVEGHVKAPMRVWLRAV